MPKKTYSVDGEIYDIEDNEASDFLKDFPNAKEVFSFKLGNDIYDIEPNEVQAFLKDMPDAKPLYDTKGASSEGTPAPSGTQQRGPMQPFQGEYYGRETEKASPVARSAKQRVRQDQTGDKTQEELIKKKQEEQIKLENLLAQGERDKWTQEQTEQYTKPVIEYIDRLDSLIEKPKFVEERNVTGVYSGLVGEVEKDALKQAQEAESYERKLEQGIPFILKEGFKQSSEKIGLGEGNEIERVAPLVEDYLSSIANESTQKEERTRWQEIQDQYAKTGSLTELDKKVLTNFADKSISGYSAIRQARLQEINREYNVDGYFNAISSANSQMTGIQRQIKALNEDKTIGAQEKQRRMMELQATAQRINDRVTAYDIPQDVLDETQSIYQELGFVKNVSNYVDLALGKKDREFKSAINKKARGERGAFEQFTDATMLAINNSVLSVFQLPKTLGDAVGLGDDTYTAVDNLYYGIQNYKDELTDVFGRDVNFDDLPLYSKIPTYLGEGIGSVLTFAGGAKVLTSGTTKLAQGLGVASSAFLTSESDYYQEAINAGMSPKEAGRVAASIAAVTASIESIIPDTEFFNASTVGRSVIKAMREGKGFGEALQLGLKEIPASTAEYLARIGTDYTKESLEEAVGGVGEGAAKAVVNIAMGKEYYEPMTTGDVIEQAFTGGLTGGTLGAVRRMVANRRSPVQESFIGDVSQKSETAIELLTNEEDIEFAKKAAERRRVYETIPQFNKLSREVQDHIISEATRADQLKAAAKKSGLEDDITAGEVADANANIMYALNNNKVRGEEKTLSEKADLKNAALNVLGQTLEQGLDGEDEEKLIESRDIDLFPETNKFSTIVGGSEEESKLSKYKEVNGIGFSEYSNPKTGDVDVIMTGTSDQDYVGFVRIYENGKPTNKWTSKFENQSGNKENFKTMISEAQKMLPKGHEYTEKTSISTDGLRVFAQQLNKGYELQYDDNGNLITNTVAINGDSKVNDLGIDVSAGNFENISVTNNKDFEKVKQVLKPYLEKFGLTENSIKWEDGTVKVDLPVLKQKTDDSKDKQGIPSEVGEGQGVVAAQPDQGAGAAPTGPSGMVQAPSQEEVELNDVRLRINQIEVARQQGKILEDESPNELKNLKSREKELSAVVSEQVAAKPTEDIEAKKADIERRRQEELDAVDIAKGGKAPIEGYEEYYKKVNAKYDAELAALEEAPTLTAEEEAAMEPIAPKVEQMMAQFPDLTETEAEDAVVYAESNDVTTEEAVSAVREVPTPKEGDTVQIPPINKYQTEPQTMVFEGGKWKQKVGGVTTAVAPAVQEAAQTAFEGTQEPVKPAAPAAKIDVQGIEVNIPDEATQETLKKERTQKSYFDKKVEELPVSDMTEQEAEQLLERDDVAILTGTNPDGNAVDDATNKKLNDKAENWLKEKGYKYHRVAGKYGQTEESFIVEGITGQDALEFAKLFQQDSVAHSEGLIYRDGTIERRVKTEDQKGVDVSNEDADFVSAVKTKDGKVYGFSMGIDFSKREKYEPKKTSPLSEKSRERSRKMREMTEGGKAAENVSKFLSDSGASVEVLDDDQYDKTTSEEKGQSSPSQGLFVSDTGKIYLRRSSIDSEWGKVIAFHEGIHPVINIIRNTNPKAYNALVKAVMESAKTNPAVAKVVRMVRSTPRYAEGGEQVIEDEVLVEVLAQIASGDIKLTNFSKTTLEKIVDFMNSLAKVFGLPKVFVNSPRAELQNLAKQLTKALNNQGNIADIVGKKNVGKFQNALSQARLTSDEIAKNTESKTKAGKIQPSMQLTAKKKGETVTVYSGASSVDAIRSNKPEMYISRALQLSKTHLVKGAVKKYSSALTKDQKLKWADNVYKKAKETVVSNLLFVYDNINEDVRNISKLWYDGANIIAQEMSKKYGVTLEQAAAVIATQSPQKPWFDNVHLAHFILDFYSNNQETLFDQSDFDYYKSKTVDPSGKPYTKQIEYLPQLEKSIGKPFSELNEYDKSAMMRARFDQNYERNAPLRVPTGAIVDAKVKALSSFSGYDTIAKAVSILQDGSDQNISDNIGNAYKVRNFYNNIASPQTDGEVTIDTHAMAVAYFLPLGSSSAEVKFDEGTYSFFADAYREAAKQRGVLAREMQSITWEGARAIFPAKEKTEKSKKAVKDVWADYNSGKITLEEAQNKIKEYGKDLSITDWGGFIDEIIDEDKTATYLKELSLVSRDKLAAGQRAKGAVDSGLPAVGKRGRKAVGQASAMDRNQIKSGFEPSKVFSGANEDVANASDQYKEENGLSQQTPSFILSVSENDAKRVADAYEKMKHDPENPQVKQGFSELITEIKKQAEVLLSMGYKFQLSKEGEGYGSDSKKMADDVRKNKRIFVDPSSKSFGTKRTFDKDNIGLQDSGYKDANGIPMTNVELIRAVHDLFGHAEFGNGFGPIGEENAWRNHMSMFTPLAQKALTSTTRGQNSWVNFGPHMRNEDGSIKKSGDEGYLTPSKRPFAEQKIGFLPEWAMDNSYGDKVTINGKSVKPVNKYVLEGTEMYEINDGKAFYEAIKAAKESRGADGIQVSLKSAEDYQNIIDNGGRLIVTKDGLAGLMVEADGNVGSGFAHADIPAGKNTLKPLLLMAIKLGARYTDAYDTYLPPYYAKFGFKALNRIEFNEEFAEEGWEKTTLSSKPDVVVMYWDGGSRENVEKNYGKFEPYSKSQGEYTDDYDGAIEAAREKSNNVEENASLVPPKIPAQASAMDGGELDSIEATSEALEELDQKLIENLPFLFNHSTQMFDFDGNPIKFETFEHGNRIFKVGNTKVQPIWFSKKPYAEGNEIRQIKTIINTKKLFDFNSEKQRNDLESFAIAKYGNKYKGISNLIKNGEWEAIEEDYGGSIPALIKEAGYDSYFSKEGNETTVAVFDPNQIKIANPQSISEAYHAAKKDGSNPELVKAVEELLVKTAQPSVMDRGVRIDPVLAAVDSEMSKKDKREMAAERKENKATFGKKYEKAVRVTKNFEGIVKELEAKGILTKKCP